ncbi:uracil-DNA glycosylase family protein [Mesorhizobium sp. L-8-3]|uniref:uracil-DNA glycosylase family protein n=1 Tax=Mesorhizobium sp. L-8-3 TaxID=2744522 RepID=UPI001936C4C5|nr:uracil-DNA glycosylase family protein [Mesorhizobium sp. L-8-3]BCH24602.1 uracil-DNA glycosylase [Mesorhizobium sp. L-8-3]
MQDTLASLAKAVRACRICRDQPRGKPLPHEPRPVLVASDAARILIAGQAPGTKVHATGIPFNDASGDRLRDWLDVSREEFYDPSNFAILPMGFCFPGQDTRGADLPPRKECAPAWRAPLLAAMPRIDLVVAIGLYAHGWHIGASRARSLTETVMNWRVLFDTPSAPRVLALPHPSWRNTGWLKRNPWFEMDLLPFLRAEIRRRLDGC